MYIYIYIHTYIYILSDSPRIISSSAFLSRIIPFTQMTLS